MRAAPAPDASRGGAVDRSVSVPSERLTRASLTQGAAKLARRDPALGRVVARHGPTPMWGRPPGFSTLVGIILEQQVSLASGRAGFARLRAVAGDVTAPRIAALTRADLLRAGLTRQKAAYIHELAFAVRDGTFDPARLARLGDDEVRAALIALRGIGPWSADIYLLMALRRADAWPSGDLALAIAAKEVLRLRVVPDTAALGRVAERWRPWRAIAARILWQHYLGAPRTPRRRAT